MSPYSYCSGNPISLVDPTGHRSGCAGGGYSLNYPRKDYNFLMWARNHPEPQERPKPCVLDFADPISLLFAHLTGMEDIFLRRQLHWDLWQQGVLEKMEFEAKKREEERQEQTARIISLWMTKPQYKPGENNMSYGLYEALILGVLDVADEAPSITGRMRSKGFLGWLFSKEITLADILIGALETGGEVPFYIYGSEEPGGGHAIFHYEDGALNAKVLHFTNPDAMLRNEGPKFFWNVFIHESMHFAFPYFSNYHVIRWENYFSSSYPESLAKYYLGKPIP